MLRNNRSLFSSINTRLDNWNIRRFDIFPKYESEVTEKSRIGGFSMLELFSY